MWNTNLFNIIFTQTSTNANFWQMLVTKTPIATTMMEIITALVCLDTTAMAQFA